MDIRCKSFAIRIAITLKSCCITFTLRLYLGQGIIYDGSLHVNWHFCVVEVVRFAILLKSCGLEFHGQMENILVTEAVAWSVSICGRHLA
jgi:hypothetical protein